MEFKTIGEKLQKRGYNLDTCKKLDELTFNFYLTKADEVEEQLSIIADFLGYDIVRQDAKTLYNKHNK